MSVLKADYTFDYYVRSLVTGTLSLGTVAVNLLLYVRGQTVPDALIGWTALILGFYFGAHSTLNGRAQGRRIERQELAAEVTAISTIQAEAGIGPQPRPTHPPQVGE